MELYQLGLVILTIICAVIALGVCIISFGGKGGGARYGYTGLMTYSEKPKSKKKKITS